MYDGVINVYKEKGFTSHDVVAKLRGILRQKKIGHTGTLDPDAVGVLPVCLGKGTKLCDVLTDKTKAYRAVLLLGVETDTEDAGGEILNRCPPERLAALTEEAVTQAVMSFVGPYDQVPPMYSALKVNGQKLCDLARAGKTVERKARRVEIFSIRIEEIALPRVTMTVECSKGTYIRTLCSDIGSRLGTGGCMEALTRIRSGVFTLETALTLGQIEALRDEGGLESRIVPVDELFSEYPRMEMRPEADRLVHNGNPFRPEAGILRGEGAGAAGAAESAATAGAAGTAENAGAAGDSAVASPAPQVRVYDSEGHFIGIYEYRRERRWYQPLKIFAGGQ